jgi:RNA polymerase sigma-70 factor (ECF subfamily)
LAIAPEIGRSDADVVANATQELYRRYGGPIYAYCLSQLRCREEAEDAVQTTFMNAFRGLQRGTTTHAEQAWLFKIAQNVCFARRSSSGRRARVESPNDFEVLQEIVPSPARNGALELFGLEEALESMPENQRRAILLREWQGLSYREIAEELELSQSAVEMLIFRARRTLASALEQPDTPRGRLRKAAHGLGLGPLVALVKSILGAGAAVKTVAAVVVAAGTMTAAAAEVEHTIVRPKPRPKPPPAATTPAVAPVRHVEPKAVVPAPEARTVTIAPAAVPSAEARPRTAKKKSALHHAPVHVAAPAPLAANDPPAPEPVQPAAPPRAPAPVSAAAPAPAAEKPKESEKPKDKEKSRDTQAAPVVAVAPAPAPEPEPDPELLQTTTTGPAPDPAPAGNGNAYGRDKDKGKDKDATALSVAPVPADGVPATAPAPAPAPAPVPGDNGNGHGNGKEKAKKDH